MAKNTYINKLVDSRNYPLILAGILFGITALLMLLVFAITRDGRHLWTVLGFELLLYMLLNAFSCLIVTKIGLYLRNTILLYILNLVLVITLIYLLLGENLKNYEKGFPAFEALVFCFFSSLMLICLIRSVVNFFKDN